jgi:hypothetical protein
VPSHAENTNPGVHAGAGTGLIRMRRDLWPPPPPEPQIRINWECVAQDLKSALRELGKVNLDALWLTAALAVVGDDAPRSKETVVSLLELVPERIGEIPADIRTDPRCDILLMVDREALSCAARAAEQALRAICD